MAAPEGDGTRLAVVTLQALTLIAAVTTSRAHPWVVWATVGTCLLLIGVTAGALLGTENLGTDSARLLAALLVAFVPPVIVTGLIRHFNEEQRITTQTIFGVLCIYLLIGLFYSAVFGAIQGISEEAFFQSGFGDTSDLLYFSFGTLTTVGFGDLIAATDLGRSLAVTEALMGQIYLVTVVAVIVGNLRQPPRSTRSA
jgi:Ion channel